MVSDRASRLFEAYLAGRQQAGQPVVSRELGELARVAAAWSQAEEAKGGLTKWTRTISKTATTSKGR
jgi:hypothetical protein